MTNSMKKIVAIIACALLLMFLTSCSSNCESIIFDNVSFGEEFYSNNVFILCNVTEVQNHINKYNSEDISQPFYQKMKSYDNSFFQQNEIIVLYHVESSSSSTISVKKLQYSDDGVKIILSRKIPEIANAAIKEYIILIEIPKNEKISSATYEFD